MIYINISQDRNGNSDGDNQALKMETDFETESLGGNADPTEHEVSHLPFL